MRFDDLRVNFTPQRTQKLAVSAFCAPHEGQYEPLADGCFTEAVLPPLLIGAAVRVAVFADASSAMGWALDATAGSGSMGFGSGAIFSNTGVSMRTVFGCG